MTALTIKSFAALGDSFTEGFEDDLGPDGRHRGWADRVAASLAQLNGGVRYANLAVRGKVLGQVVAEQVGPALELQPDLISFHAGINDLLRPRVDRQAILDHYTATVRRLRESGAQVLLFTVVGRTGGTGRTADNLAARFERFSDHVRAVAAENDCLVADIGSEAALQDRRLLHEDRLHPSAAGHERVASAVLEALGVQDPAVLGGELGWWRVPLPAAQVGTRLAAVQADVRWGWVYLRPWIGRRLRGASSGDDILPKHPELIDVHPGSGKPGTSTVGP